MLQSTWSTSKYHDRSISPSNGHSIYHSTNSTTNVHGFLPELLIDLSMLPAPFTPFKRNICVPKPRFVQVPSKSIPDSTFQEKTRELNLRKPAAIYLQKLASVCTVLVAVWRSTTLDKRNLAAVWITTLSIFQILSIFHISPFKRFGIRIKAKCKVESSWENPTIGSGKGWQLFSPKQRGVYLWAGTTTHPGCQSPPGLFHV